MGMLKIIGGYLAGRTILSVPGENTRPPLARVRESVGNILQTRVVGSKVLDLFAGTGSYSFELLSRGAERAILIDKNPRAVEIIKKNAAKLGLQSQTQVVHADALDMIKRFMQSRETFDIIIVAPPYFTRLDQAAMKMLSSKNLLGPDGIIVLQQARKERFHNEYGLLKLRKTYNYGDTRISTYISSEPHG
ncbi:MAG: 16S rRNA (guanine(966)-N(2))-methyltransferase RsmD [Bacillota bacterium]|jgi:16S rRNA (guanine966-N2)-methyltransferase